MVGEMVAGRSPRIAHLETDMSALEPNRRQHRRRRLLAAAPLALALLASGCNSSRQATGGDVTGSLPGATAQSAELQRAVDYWSKKFASNPADKSAAINLSRMLRAQEKAPQAIAIMRQAEVRLPKDRDVLAELGKGLAEAGRNEDAEKVLTAALASGRPDWQLLSARGAALDQLQQHGKAREDYARALAVVPNEPSVLNNLGLSYALDRNLPKAEEVLRKAAQNPQAGREVKENLALVLGLQGKFDEAERVARTALPETAVSSNMSYLKQLLSQPSSWAKLQALEAKNKPSKHR
jgi:Flp pilus assembly protein TadD